MPPRFAPKKLVDYPWVVVRVDCVLCHRAGRYRLARLAARYGPEQSLEGLLADLAHDCPWWRSNPRRYEPRCGARLVDVERDLPPPDHPAEPMFRRREPAREDVPKPKGADKFPATHRGSGPTLSGWRGDHVCFACRKCDRSGVVRKAELLERFGDKLLTLLIDDLTAGCPRHGSAEVYGVCGAMYVGLWTG